MFDRYMGAKQEKRNKVFRLILVVSGVLHILGFVAAIIWSFWKIEKLVVKDSSVLYAAASMSTPPPPPPPPPPPKRSTQKTEVKQIKPTEMIQPPKEIKELPKAQEESSDEDEGEEGGEEGGVKGGVIGGVVGGVIGGEIGGELGGELGAVVPPPTPATAVPQQMLEGQRIAGEKQIKLTDPMLTMLKNQGVQKMAVRAKMCLDDNGSITSIEMSKSSGYPDIDAHIQSKMREWRFKPWVVAGKQVKICTPIIFNYTFQN